MTNTFLVTGRGVKSIPLNSLPARAWQTIVGQLTGDDSDTDIVTLYEHIPWLHRGVEARVNALSGMPISIHRGDASGDELEPDDYPFPIDLSSFLAVLYRWYILFARAYVWKNPNVFNEPIGLRLFHPRTITNEVSKTQGITGYRRRLGMDVKTYPLEEVAYWWKAGAKDEVGHGVSDAMVAAAAAGILYSMDMHDKRFFSDGAINPTLVSVGSGTQPPDRERLRSWYKRILGGVKNAFSIEVVEGKPEITTFGYRPKDLVSVELTTQKREDIATALGVPQTLMFSNAANYATAAQDDLHFYDKTIKPDANQIEAILNRDIFNSLGYTLKFHPERMELFQQLEDSKAGAVTTLWDSGLMEYEEGREHMNLPPAPKTMGEQDIEKRNQLNALSHALQSGVPYDVAAQLLNIPITSTHPETAPVKSVYHETIAKWKRMALKRWQEGKPAKALDFKSEGLTPSQSGSIRGALSKALTREDVTRVFDHALHFADYP